jgi:hypothetical protein
MINLFDITAFVLKVVGMFLLSAISQEALRKKMFGLSITALGMWLILFRLVSMRAVIIYEQIWKIDGVGVVYDFFESAPVAMITDAVLVIGLFVLSFTIARYYIKLNSEA